MQGLNVSEHSRLDCYSYQKWMSCLGGELLEMASSIHDRNRRVNSQLGSATVHRSRPHPAPEHPVDRPRRPTTPPTIIVGNILSTNHATMLGKEKQAQDRSFEVSLMPYFQTPSTTRWISSLRFLWGKRHQGFSMVLNGGGRQNTPLPVLTPY